MKIALASDLEKALLRSIAEGVCPPDVVSPEELSKEGQQTHGSILHLLKRRVQPPLKPDSILLTAQNLYSVDAEEFKDYLRGFRGLEVGGEIQSILHTAREKALLVRLINQAGEQLAAGRLDARALRPLIEENEHANTDITPLALSVRDKFPDTPVGLNIKSLPALTRATNGLIGFWVLGGEPGLGKSTLAFQIGLDVAGASPVIYYDLDGTGHEWLLHRVSRICGGSVRAFKQLTKQFHLRETISTLEDDIAAIRKQHGDGKIVIVIDSLQTLPTSIKYKKEGLDNWIGKFKQLTKKDVMVIGVSEQNRAAYGEAKMAGFKGTGDIEYAGSLCMQLLQEDDADAEDPVQVWIVKNRHGNTKGHVIDLERDRKKIWWFNEEEPL